VKEKKRLLGVDFGKVRIGLAISDRDWKIASPLATYTRKNAQADEQFFRNLTETEEVGLIVVGLPIHVDGQEGASAQAARKFGQWLEKATKLPVLMGSRPDPQKAEGSPRSRGRSVSFVDFHGSGLSGTSLNLSSLAPPFETIF
jgi:putative Holliday junction resolvase